MSETKKESVWKAYRFPIILFTCIGIGTIVGLVMGEKAAALKPFGDLFLNMMFTIVVPLVFFTISSAIASMADLKRLGKILKNLFLVFAVTGLIASVVMLTATQIFPPGVGVDMALPEATTIEPFNTADQLVAAFTVPDFVMILSREHMLPLIMFSMLFGFSCAVLGDKGKKVAGGLTLMSEVCLTFVKYIMYYAPFGLGCYFAALVGEFGPELLGSYAQAMAVYYPVCFGYFFIAFFCYAYYAGGMECVKRFFKGIPPAAVTALATQSSIATLPTNLAVTAKMGVPKDIREIVLPLGATMHMDGTCLASILKITFLFGIFGIPFEGIGTFASAILISVISGVVMSGVPGGGLIGEMLIVNLYGFPPEAFPIVATIGYLVDPPATMVNSTGDSVASLMVTRLIDGKDWIKKPIIED